MKKFLFIFLAVISLKANSQVLDSIKKDITHFHDTVKHLHSKAYALIVPAGLVGYGALSFAVHPLQRFDHFVTGETHEMSPDFNTKAESYFLFGPVIAVYGLNLIGDEGKNRFVDRTALLGLSTAFMSLSTFPLKSITHRLRPDGSDYLSFPSGHTAAAFALAEFMAQEYGDKSPLYTIVGYSFATTTGIFRVYNRAHWFSDVVAGAGFGILSTKAAYLVYPYIRSWLTHSDEKTGKSTFVMPTFENGTPGLSLSMRF
ncbi:MAG: phosphatase PAP2 family protein [Bacteroidetes bacterium]|nr:phosphatase PAP2 family protein [Bacteroidota bacterium]